MKKIVISEKERSRILESHNKVRDILMGHLFDTSLLSEQDPGVKPLQGKALLEKAKTDCKGFSINPNVVMGTKKAADGQTKDALVIKASQNYTDKVANKEVFKAGDTMYYFPDMTYEVYTPTTDGKETLVYTNNWSCSALNVVAKDIEERKKALIAAGWLEYDTLSGGDKQSVKTQPQLWQKILIGSDTLVFPQAKKQPNELSDEAVAYLEKITSGQYGVDFVLASEADTDQRTGGWIKDTITNPDFFSQPIIIYRDPSKTSAPQILSLSNQTIEAQRVDEKTCSGAMLNLLNSYNSPSTEQEVQKQLKLQLASKCYAYYKRGAYKSNRDLTKMIQALEGNSYEQNKYVAVPRTSQYNILNVAKKYPVD